MEEVEDRTTKYVLQSEEVEKVTFRANMFYCRVLLLISHPTSKSRVGMGQRMFQMWKQQCKQRHIKYRGAETLLLEELWVVLSYIAGVKQEMWQKTRLRRSLWQGTKSPGVCGLSPLSCAWARWQHESLQPSVVASQGNLLVRPWGWG